MINADNTVTYTPDPDYHGNDSFTYTVTTAVGDTEVGFVTVVVAPVVDAVADTPITAEDMATTVSVLGNDTFAAGANVTSVGAAANGTVVLNADNTVTYTPNADYHGNDGFTYTVTTAAGNTETGTVAVRTIPIIDVAGDKVKTAEDTSAIVDVLGNDTFGVGANVTTVGVASHGTVVLNADNTVTYTPDPDYHGNDNFTYTVTTAAGNTETGSVAVVVTSVADAQADKARTTEDTPVTVDVLGNDTFGAGANVISLGTASHGTVVLNADNTVTYTPNTDYHGGDGFTYTVRTAAGNVETGAVALVVPAVVDVVTDTPSTAEDTPVTVDVLGNDTFGAGANVTSVGTASNGVVVLHADNTLTYTPNLDYHGNDSFTYTVTTAAGKTETGTVAVVVTSVADVIADTSNTVEDTAVTVDVLGNDTFGAGATVTAMGTAANGLVVVNPDGTVKYTPNADFHGSDSFNYEVTTAAGNTEAGTVSVLVASAIDAIADNSSTLEDHAVTVDVLANDSFGAGAAVTSVGTVSNGTVTINVDNTLTFTPNTNFNGSTTFVYTVTTAVGDTETAIVAITVTPVNDTPVASNHEPIVTDEDVAVADIDVLRGSSDADGDELIVSGATATHGTVTVAADGNLLYTPGAEFNGVDTIRYTISDGQGGVVSAAIGVSVLPVNDAPLSIDDAPVEISQGNIAREIDVLSNDVDMEGGPLTLIEASADNGIVTINIDGSLTYTPDRGFNGEDKITYTLADAEGALATGIATIHITPVNEVSIEVPGAVPELSDAYAQVSDRARGALLLETFVEAAPAEQLLDSVALLSASAAEVALGGGATAADSSTAPSQPQSSRTAGPPVAVPAPEADTRVKPGQSPRSHIADIRSLLSARAAPSMAAPVDTALTPQQIEQIEAKEARASLFRSLDQVASEVNEQASLEQRELVFQLNTAKSVAVGLSAGYLTWMLRAGSLLASVLSSMPLWTKMDPLPVLALDRRERERKQAAAKGDSPAMDRDEERVRRILRRPTKS